MVGDKLRFRFEKAGDLRLLSHHDLMRCAERTMRRASIPFKMTAGFHPAPRLVFALSLSLGIVGRNEVVELELAEPRESEDVLSAFRNQAPKGWNFLSVQVVPMKASAVARRIVYRLSLPDDRIESVRAMAESLVASAEVWVDRYHPRPRQVDIRQYLRGLRVEDSSLLADIWVTSTGTARADELLKLLGLSDLVDSGCALSRDLVELRDEITGTADPADQPPDGPADTLPLDPAAVGAAHRDNENTPTEG